MQKSNVKELKKSFADYVVIKNPIDLTGDATTEGFETAIRKCLEDKNIDIVIAITLMQTPMITSEIVDVITKLNNMKKKPLVVVTTGSRFVETIKQALEENKVPSFTFPENAVNAIKQLVLYAKRK
jgi:acetyltransferase